LLISTHTMSAVEPLATDVAILLEGKLAAHGCIEELREQFGNESLETIYHAVARSHRCGGQICAPPRFAAPECVDHLQHAKPPEPLPLIAPRAQAVQSCLADGLLT
jgi:hypothetical protein